jgi:hypothetical protein
LESHLDEVVAEGIPFYFAARSRGTAIGTDQALVGLLYCERCWSISVTKADDSVTIKVVELTADNNGGD